VDVLVADAADNQGFAAAGSHPHDPFRWVLAPLRVQILEGANVMNFHLLV
jgi:hypothetical protein